MHVLALIWPPLLVILTALGIGTLCFRLLRSFLPVLPIAVESCLAYFLGQGILTSAFLLSAVAGVFTPTLILGICLPSGALGLWYLVRESRRWQSAGEAVLRQVKTAPPLWTMAGLVLLLMTLAGVTALQGFLEGDPIAFYFAIAKYMAELHKLEPLPGAHEFFSSVGLNAETLIAALMALGMPNISPRIFSWINFLPILVLLYAIPRHFGLGRRAGLIAMVVAVTSTNVLYLWGTAKTDLFAVGPALAALYCGLCSWELGGTSPGNKSGEQPGPQPGRWLWLILAGYFAGYACVLKLSYLVPLLPTLGLLVAWQTILRGLESIRQRHWSALAHRLRPVPRQALLCAGGFMLAFAPHAVKNLILFHQIIGFGEHGTYYTATTTWRLVLTYPLALTFGNYWAQMGNLSPLVLAFAPLFFWIRRPASWTNSKPTAFGVTTLIGLLFWVGLLPSIFMPRYILATLLSLGIIVALPVEVLSRQSRILCRAIPLILILVMLLVGYSGLKPWAQVFTNPLTLRNYPFTDADEWRVAGQMADYCRTEQVINARAALGDRVFVLYYRYWLRSDLLEHAARDAETDIKKDTGYWTRLVDGKFRFLLYDPPLAGHFKPEQLAAPPAGIILEKVTQYGGITVYEIKKTEPPH